MEENQTSIEVSLESAYGSLTPEEKENMVVLSNMARAALHEMGVNRQQARALDTRFDTIQLQTQSLVNAIAKRVGVPDGKEWTINGDQIVIINKK